MVRNKGVFIRKAGFVLLICLFFSVPLSFGKKLPEIPEPLKPWTGWVLHDQQEKLRCIPKYNNGEELQCNWPTALDVNITDKGGQFSQSWEIHNDTLIALPGDNRQWPQDVYLNGKQAIVLDINNLPRMQLTSGTHRITGSFDWQNMPEYLRIPAETALITLKVNNQKIAFPNMDASGRLWLKAQQSEEKIENRLQLKSYRMIREAIPSTVVILGDLDVAGSNRQIILGPVFDHEKFIPFSLTSDLPVRLESDGRMRIQVRPGRFQFTLSLHHFSPLGALSFQPPDDGFWPGEEIWAYAADTSLRSVEIEGVPPIDPQQTTLPSHWKSYPAYRLLPGETMTFKEIKRGDPHPAPDQLQMNRSLWLRFDGSGYAIRDHVTGLKNTDWRLEMDPSIMLARVTIDGMEQLITKREDSEKDGVELRKGILDLTGDSVYAGNISSLPAIGWDHDFQQVKGKLFLPPGWKLLHASGMDAISQTWVKRWTLLDFFLVLIFTISAAKLFSRPIAVVAFLTLVLIYHEPGAPRYVWIALLIGWALLKYLPDGRFKKIVKIYQVVTALILVLIAIPYAIRSLRVGIYPQLEFPYISMSASSLQEPQASIAQNMRGRGELAPSEVQKSKKAEFTLNEVIVTPERRSAVGQDRYSTSLEKQVAQYDPNAMTQTGPGLPSWQPFATISYEWSGPVARDQRISFKFIGPKINLVLAFLRVGLIISLGLGMFGCRYRFKTGVHFQSYLLFAIPVFLFFIFVPSFGCANGFPSNEMLNELQKRLLEKDECFPGCASIPDLEMNMTPDNLSISMHVHTQIDTAVPLPCNVSHWLPQQIRLDGKTMAGLFRSNNQLWAHVPSGIHVLNLSGKIRKQNTFVLPFTVKPRKGRLSIKGWTVEGVDAEGNFDSQLQFKRIVEEKDNKTEILETGILPPFAIIQREILLGLVWKVVTTVEKISPSDSALVLNIPLLPGESVTTEGLRVNNGMVQINMTGKQHHSKWESFLAQTDVIELKHPKTTEWTEIWTVNVSPIFHMEASGIPVILHKQGDRWYPTWHPWPEEQVVLRISRPLAVKGQTMTIEKSRLELRPGQRSTNASLNLTVKSSIGGQHAVNLPLNAVLQEVLIDGKIQPIRQEGQQVPLPITPGLQEFHLKWQAPEGIKAKFNTSDIDLNSPSVNASADIYLPKNRWPLFVGGESLVGPAVLFWSVFCVIVLVAFGLSKTSLTPLKFRHWLLLGLGMSMSNLAACIIIVGWLIALDFRKKAETSVRINFNLIQICIGVLTVLAMGAFVFSISRGLIGHPDMNIVGNGSNSSLLRWYQDVSGGPLPRAWIFSIPLYYYRIAMLAWALWVSFYLIKILKWGWDRFTSPTIWYGPRPKNKQNEKDPPLSI